jgi:hypothetical protein
MTLAAVKAGRDLRALGFKWMLLLVTVFSFAGRDGFAQSPLTQAKVTLV